MLLGVSKRLFCAVLAVFFSMLFVLNVACAEGVDGKAVPGGVNASSSLVQSKLAIGSVSPLVVRLAPLPPGAKAAGVSSKDAPLKLGVERKLPSRYSKGLSSFNLTWHPTNDGGHAAVLAITDPGARAMRLGLEIEHINKGTELRFYGKGVSPRVYGPYPEPGKDIRYEALGGMFWSPVVNGDTIFMEIYLPSGLGVSNAPKIRGIKISHLWTSLRSGFKRLADIGSSGVCEVDIACQANWSPLDGAVGKVVFQTQGGTAMCTGTLLNDSDPNSTIPYFITANHCISTASEAASATFYWNFKKSVCGGINPVTVQQTVGASLLTTSRAEDSSLLRLRTLPQGVFLAGWDNIPFRLNMGVTGIHHPRGDLKKISNGRTLPRNYRVNMANNRFTVAPNPAGHHLGVIWNSGVTEPGSSGSGIFLNSNRRFIGVLSGGGSSCQVPNQPDYYGRFAMFYRQASGFINQRQPVASTMLSPVSGSRLTARTVTFRWANTGAFQYALRIGTTLGGRQVYARNMGALTTATVTVPANGRMLYVRLMTRPTSASPWTWRDYTYYAPFADDHGNSTAAATAVGVPSTTAGVINYAGDNDYFRIVVPRSGRLTVNTTGNIDTVGHLLNSAGRQLAWNDDALGALGLNFRIIRNVTPGTYYVRVRHFRHFGTGPYTLHVSLGGAIQPATMISPAPNSVLPSGTVTFRWTNTGAFQYVLRVGTTVGGGQIYNRYVGRATSATVTGLPTNGQRIYVRLYTRATSASGWQWRDYSYTVRAVRAATMLSPAPGSI